MRVRRYWSTLLAVFVFGMVIAVAAPVSAAKKVVSPEVNLPSNYCGRWYGYLGRQKMRKHNPYYQYSVVKVNLTSPKNGISQAVLTFYITRNKSLKKLKYISRTTALLKANKVMNRRTRHVSYAIRPQLSRQKLGNLTLTTARVKGHKQTALRFSIENGVGLNYAFRKLQRTHKWAGL